MTAVDINKEELLKKFQKCYNAKYTTVANDASFYVERDGAHLTLLFEKSNSGKDWKSNFNFPAKPYRKMKNKWFCHRGFLKVWRSIEPYVEKDIKDQSVTEIDIVGYSHGGAIAELCYEYVKFNRPDVSVTGVGFGAPRVLWGFVRKAVKRRFDGFVVVRNGCDIVTHVPPVVFGFRNMGLLKKVGKKGQGLFKSHSPAAYIEALSEQKKGTD